LWGGTNKRLEYAVCTAEHKEVLVQYLTLHRLRYEIGGQAVAAPAKGAQRLVDRTITLCQK